MTEHTSILKRSRASFKQPGMIPSGVWEVRCISAKHKTATVEHNGEDTEIDIFTFTHEPMTPGKSVDPEEADAVDPETGKSLYDGKRLITVLRIYNNGDLQRVQNLMNAHLGDPDEDATLEEDLKSMKGKRALADVFTDSWKDKTSGETRSDNRVKSWASAE